MSTEEQIDDPITTEKSTVNESREKRILEAEERKKKKLEAEEKARLDKLEKEEINKRIKGFIVNVDNGSANVFNIFHDAKRREDAAAKGRFSKEYEVLFKNYAPTQEEQLAYAGIITGLSKELVYSSSKHFDAYEIAVSMVLDEYKREKINNPNYNKKISKKEIQNIAEQLQRQNYDTSKIKENGNHVTYK